MARRKRKAEVLDLKAQLGDQEDFLRPLVQEIVQSVLEEGMAECLQAAKSERTASRLMEMRSKDYLALAHLG